MDKVLIGIKNDIEKRTPMVSPVGEDIFKIRMELFEKFKAGKVSFDTLTAEVYRRLNKLKTSGGLAGGYRPENLFARYLIAICKLERRISFEYQLMLVNLGSEKDFRRVGNILFSEISLCSKKILQQSIVHGIMPKVHLGPKGVLVMEIPNSPLGKIIIGRSDFLSVVKNFSATEQIIKSNYLKSLLSFL